MRKAFLTAAAVALAFAVAAASDQALKAAAPTVSQDEDDVAANKQSVSVKSSKPAAGRRAVKAGVASSGKSSGKLTRYSVGGTRYTSVDEGNTEAAASSRTGKNQNEKTGAGTPSKAAYGTIGWQSAANKAAAAAATTGGGGNAGSSGGGGGGCSAPSAETRTVECTDGSVGTMVQTRTWTCPGPTAGEWTTLSSVCAGGGTVPAGGTCAATTECMSGLICYAGTTSVCPFENYLAICFSPGSKSTCMACVASGQVQVPGDCARCCSPDNCQTGGPLGAVLCK